MQQDSGHSDYKTPFLFSIILLLGMFLGYKMSLSFKGHSSSSKNPQLDALIQLIDAHYVDSLNTDTLYQNGINGIIRSLDPHTVYIPKQELILANEELQGEFFGIGIEFYIWKDTIRIADVMKDGPSSKTPIRPGDKIISIDGQNMCTKDLNSTDVTQKIRGRHESHVELRLLHPDQTPYTCKIKRGKVALHTISSGFMLTSTTGFIAIRMFSETTADEFHETLDGLIKKGLRKLILDVRGNPGGYMDAVTQIADELIPGKQMLVQTKGKNSHEEVFSSKAGLFEKGEVAVLIDENSASASEILAGIIQDLERGTVIGRRSYGKGLVQEQYELPDQSAIRITIARYYLPSGRCIQKDYSAGKDQYHEDIYHRYQLGELVHADSVKHPNSAKDVFRTTGKRIVFAHEGISPDYFIGIDSTLEKEMVFFYEDHVSDEFCNRYYYLNQKEFSHQKDMISIEKNLLQNQKMWDAFLFNTKSYPEMKIPAVKDKVKQHIMAGFAQLMSDHNSYSFFIAKQDPAVMKALSLLK